MDDGVTYADEIARLRRERRQRAWQLHRDGLSYRKIGQLLGISHVQILHDVEREQARRDEITGEPEPRPDYTERGPRPRPLTAPEYPADDHEAMLKALTTGE